MGRTVGSKNKVLRGNVGHVGFALNEREMIMFETLLNSNQYYGLKPSDVIRILIAKEFTSISKGE